MELYWTDNVICVVLLERVKYSGYSFSFLLNAGFKLLVHIFTLIQIVYTLKTSFILAHLEFGSQPCVVYASPGSQQFVGQFLG